LEGGGDLAGGVVKQVGEKATDLRRCVGVALLGAHRLDDIPGEGAAALGVEDFIGHAKGKLVVGEGLAVGGHVALGLGVRCDGGVQDVVGAERLGEAEGAGLVEEGGLGGGGGPGGLGVSGCARRDEAAQVRGDEFAGNELKPEIGEAGGEQVLERGELIVVFGAGAIRDHDGGGVGLGDGLALALRGGGDFFGHTGAVCADGGAGLHDGRGRLDGAFGGHGGLGGEGKAETEDTDQGEEARELHRKEGKERQRRTQNVPGRPDEQPESSLR